MSLSLKNSADRRTVAWLVLAASNVAVAFAFPALRWWLCPLACYFALAAGIIAHNHNHNPAFLDRRANEWLNHAATAFYGFAAFNWVPTHNANHHKFTNASGDATITWRLTHRHNLAMAIVYPFVSTWYQLPLIDRYLKDTKEKRPAHHRHLLVQLFICWGLPLALTLPNWRVAVAMIWVPRLFSLWTIMYFNYAQHVHCDASSQWNHSRNFTNPVLNFFLFNNGFHTVHHMKPGAHWTALPAMHAEIQSNIDPALNLKSFSFWLFDNYVLGTLLPFRGTKQVGAAPGLQSESATNEEAVAAE